MDCRKGWIDGNANRREQDEESFEYMRRKLWCDVLFQAIGMSNERGVALADEVIELFDERFGKGEGE